MSEPSSNRPLAVTFGCEGPELSDAEFRLFREADPVAFVIFRRNCKDREQLRRLTDRMREAVGRTAPVLVDQEGGRVQRLRPPTWPKDPSARVIGDLYRRDPERGLAAVRLLARAIASDLLACGVDVDAVPVLDVGHPFTHDVIGDRSYADDVETVITLGRAMAETMLASGVQPIMKHIPGHGRTLCDSHQDLPVVEADLETLETIDFAPFIAMADLPWAMTAHIVYRALDPEHPATQSSTIIEGIVRDCVGFQGVLVSDDLSMEALSGSIEQRAVASLQAGCDIALHCNGKLDEMEALASAVPRITDATVGRLEAAAASVGSPTPIDTADARRQVADWLAA
ncbi:MAG: beta-N-acetylhexosaminidase [Pseudomonadota bacterium]